MVKRIEGNRPKGVGESSPIESGKAVGPASVSGVSGVGSIEQQQGVARTGRAGSILRAGERDKLFKMIEEESEKLFEESSIPPEKRKVLQQAVKMAVDAGIVDEEEKKS